MKNRFVLLAKSVLACASLVFLSLVSVSAKAENYLTFTVVEGDVILQTPVNFASSEDSFGHPSMSFPVIYFSVNGGEWCKMSIEFNDLYFNSDGDWEGTFTYSNQIFHKGDVIRLKGNNSSLNSYATGRLRIMLLTAEYFGKATVSITGNPTSLLDGTGNLAHDSSVEGYLVSEQGVNIQSGGSAPDVEGDESKLALTDNTADIAGVVSSGIDYSVITYTRDIKAKWNTVCLPFNVSSTDDNKFYTVESLEDGVITLKYVDELLAGTPALVSSSETGELVLCGSGVLASQVNNAEGTNRLVGSYEAAVVPGASDAEHVFYGLSANTGSYVRVSSDVAVRPFRAYIECEKNAANMAGIRVRVADDDSEFTSISEVVSMVTDEAAEYFDINGRKTDGLVRGMNVVVKNGKAVKVMVK